MNRMAVMVIIFIAPICCCLGAALQEDVSDFVVQAPVRERAFDFIILTPPPTPTPAGGAAAGGTDNGNDKAGDPESGVSENKESAGDETDDADSSFTPPQTSSPEPISEPALATLTPPTLIPARPSSTASATPIPTLELTPAPTAAAAGPSPVPDGDGGGSDDGDDNDDGDANPTIPPTSLPTTSSTATPSSTSSATSSPTVTIALTSSPTSSATLTPTSSPTVTIALTSSPTSSATLTPTSSPTVTVTLTPSPTSSATLTPTSSPTVTMTLTPSPTITSTPTITVTPTITPAASVIGFSPAAYSVAEADGTAMITVVLDQSSSQTVTVEYASNDGSALAGNDYTGVTGVLTFLPGETSRSFSVPIFSDSLDEPDETLTLTLSNPQPDNASLGVRSAKLTIIDDDQPPAVQFERSNYSVGEDNGPAIINVELTAPSAFTVTVVYATGDITATAGQDYTPVTGVLTFAPGQTSRSINLSLTNDPEIECSEDMRLTLNNPDQATLGAPSTATLTIVNDDFQATMTDDNEMNCNCTLREAIITANTNTPVDACPVSMTDTITLSSGTYQLTLTGAGEDAALTGDLDITEDLTIIGTDATVIDAGGLGDRVFHILSGSVTFTQVEIVKGGAVDGGGVLNAGDLTISNSVIRDNEAERDGGGIFNNGALTLMNSTVMSNTAAENGGAIFTNGDVTISRSTLAFNQATNKSGGAILANTGVISIIASTISQNTAGRFGGGLATNASGKPPVSIIDSTFFQNSAGNNGGGGVRDFSSTVTFRNTIIAGSLTGGDCKGNVTSAGYNLDSDGSCVTTGNNDITKPDPGLGPLQDNGGPTETHALLLPADFPPDGSPAIDAGNCPGSFVDQRGFSRPVDRPNPNAGDSCDIGAYELGP